MSGETEAQISGWTTDTLKGLMFSKIDGVLALVEALSERHRADVQSLRIVVDERDRLYLERSNAQKVAVDAALAAQKEMTAAAFLASEKAIGKAEGAQHDYNVRSNEFRGQLADQAKMLLPRAEAETRFKNNEEKIDDLRQDVGRLREFKSSDEAVEAAHEGQRKQTQWSTGLIVAIALAGLSAILTTAGIIVRVLTGH